MCPWLKKCRFHCYQNLTILDSNLTIQINFPINRFESIEQFLNVPESYNSLFDPTF